MGSEFIEIEIATGIEIDVRRHRLTGAKPLVPPGSMDSAQAVGFLATPCHVAKREAVDVSFLVP